MKRKTFVLAVALAVPGLMAMGSAKADTEFNFSGFGTLGYSHSNSKEVDYAASLYAPNGVGATHSTALSSDTRAGVQASANFGSGLSGVLQVVSDIRADNSYQPKFEWANLKYQATQDTSVRIGRVVTPIFMTSEYRNVGYAQTAVRASWDVYSQNPLTHIDGGNVSTKFDVGGGVLSAALTGGRVKDFLSGAKISGSTEIGNLLYEIGSSTVNFGYGKFKLDLGFVGTSGAQFNQYLTAGATPVPIIDPSTGNPVINPSTGAPMMTTLGALLNYPAVNLKASDIHGHMLDLGYTYDPGTWIVQTEYVERKSDSTIIQDTKAWSLLAGYRIGKFTPYASYSQIKSSETQPAHPPANLVNLFPPGTPAAVITAATNAQIGACAAVGFSTPACQPVGAMLLFNGMDTSFSSQITTEHTVSFGVRYDFYKNLALKAQYDRISKPANSMGQFVTTPGGVVSSWYDYSKTVNILTVNLDFVF